jgi:hypothetical protein
VVRQAAAERRAVAVCRAVVALQGEAGRWAVVALQGEAGRWAAAVVARQAVVECRALVAGQAAVGCLAAVVERQAVAFVPLHSHCARWGRVARSRLMEESLKGAVGPVATW